MVNPNEDPDKGGIVRKSQINWQIIYPAVREYIRRNPTQFYLDNEIMYDRDGIGNGLNGL